MMVISKPVSTHCFIAARTFSGRADALQWNNSGFSLVHGATTRYIRLMESPLRSRSVESKSSSHTRNVSNVSPGASVFAGPIAG